MKILTRDEVLAIPASDLPLFVLTDHAFSIIALIIRKYGRRQHVGGFYNHAMLMDRPREVVSQGWTLRRQPIDYWLRNCRAKFWKPTHWTRGQRDVCAAIVAEKLERPWWLRVYDLKGVIGQALGRRSIQSAWRDYCSEFLADILHHTDGYRRAQASPCDLNADWKTNTDFAVYGYYEPD